MLSLVIILHHLAFQYNESWFFSQFSILGTITVSLFFFLSGYGLMKQYLKHGDDYHKEFLSKRFSKLLPSFLTATLLYTIYMICNQGGGYVWNRFVTGFPPLPTSWFVYSIIWFYLTYYFIGMRTKNINVYNLLMFVSTVVYCVLVLFVLKWGGWWVNAILAINLGMFICSYESRLLVVFNKKSICVILSLVFACVTLVAVYLKLTPVYNLTVCCLLWMSFANKKPFEAIPLKQLSKISHEVYLVQGAAIALLVKYVHINEMLPLIGTCVTFLVTIIVAYLLQKTSFLMLNTLKDVKR